MKLLSELQIETSGNTRLLWHHQYWDGPISGIMLWEGEVCWFQQFGEDIIEETQLSDEEWKIYVDYCQKHGYTYLEQDRYDHDMFRHMKVYRLPQDVLEAITYNHELFKKYVGGHTEYDFEGKRSLDKVKPPGEHHKFYNDKDSHKSYEFNLSNYVVIGEFLR